MPSITIDPLDPPPVTMWRRFRLFLSVIVVVILLSLIKAGIHWLGWEFLNLNALFTSAIASAVFIIGFLLSSVLTDYKEAERLPTELRVALEAIHDDACSFAEAEPAFSAEPTREILRELLGELSLALGKHGETDLRPVLDRADRLTDVFVEMERLGMPPNYVVRLKSEQNALRRSLFRLYQIQKIKFVPSVHILVQTLVAAITLLLLFLRTEGSPESALIFGFIAYMFTYALYLIDTLEKPFRKRNQSLDDVSFFLLRELEAKFQKQ
jgi:hypothetical protein